MESPEAKRSRLCTPAKASVPDKDPNLLGYLCYMTCTTVRVSPLCSLPPTTVLSSDKVFCGLLFLERVRSLPQGLKKEYRLVSERTTVNVGKRKEGDYKRVVDVFRLVTVSCVSTHLFQGRALVGCWEYPGSLYSRGRTFRGERSGTTNGSCSKTEREETSRVDRNRVRSRIMEVTRGHEGSGGTGDPTSVPGGYNRVTTHFPNPHRAKLPMVGDS